MGTSIDGEKYVRNLASYIYTHEKRLANASSQFISTSIFSSQPVQLHLTLHHLYFLLTQFEDIDVNAGPLNIRIENLHSEAFPSDYTSFLKNRASRKVDYDDNMSMKSVATIGSILSQVSSLWSRFSTASTESTEHRNRLKLLSLIRYIYSSFTKLPFLSLVYNPKAVLISQFEEFPLDTAVPVTVFKNLSSLEVRGYDVRSIYGWNSLSLGLKSLVLHRCDLVDLSEVLIKLVLDDTDLYRFRSSRQNMSQSSTISQIRSPAKSLNLRRSVSLGSKDQSSPQHSNNFHRTLSQSVLVLSKDGGNDSSNLSVKSNEPLSDAESVMSSHAWSQLLYFRCSNCNLKYVSSKTFLPLASLLSLDLSGNQLVELPSALAELPQLRSLNLANNKLVNCRTLYHIKIPNLQTLVLACNQLKDLSGLEAAPTLQRLDVRDNLIVDPVEFRRLIGNTNFEEAYISSNPFTKTNSSHRIMIFNYFREFPESKDILLDGRGPSMLERMYLAEKATPSTNLGSRSAGSDTGAVIHPTKSTLRRTSKTRLVDLSLPSANVSRARAGSDILSTQSGSSVTKLGTSDASHDAGESFRKKIEALRQEAGNEWIEALVQESLTRQKNHAEKDLN
ncbi:leucine-rich repeat protein [Schizosaccharomyces osmophilus]|uniref:Leucine-rich repeat protein n=1 Tax=Schizosaccharomyces osmophilus TaxID=2545709 RepID=A0AAE9WI99_9SCHI|nr:leucine-rich repeat protein [Schizosaccharomyces osmophilus]WBW75216.1 leucine-rich repeat protein [Schizosaccharomyces osmophilus]